MNITLHDGLYWPANDRAARPVILRDRDRDIAALLEHVSGRACIVQAGGNVGVYAMALAAHFPKVFTFEPDPLNYECLRRNRLGFAAWDRIHPFNAGLGETYSRARIVQEHAGNCGAHRVELLAGPEDGCATLIPLDSIQLQACDAIWLDVEGHELPALKGARATIERFRPVIATEEKGLGGPYGVAGGDIEAWLAGLDYQKVDRIGRDNVYRSKL